MSNPPGSENDPVTGNADGGWLTGSCLISMPTMTDPRFHRTIIFLCTHDEDGAMGLVVNRPHNSIDFRSLRAKLKLSVPDGPAENDAGQTASQTAGHGSAETSNIPVLAGGPVEIGRGFVLHQVSADHAGSLQITDDLALCATMEAIEGLARGNGPPSARIALGYAGWGAGQLEDEIRENAWLVCKADAKLVLQTVPDQIYAAALDRLGIDLAGLVSTSGRA